MNAVAAFPSAHLSSNMYPSLHAKVCDTRKTDTLHFHNHIQIWYVLKGSMKHFVKDVCFEQKEGSCVCVLPYTVHNIDTRKSSDLPAVVELTFHDEFLLNNNFRFFANSASHAQFEEKKLPIFFEFTQKKKEQADVIVNKMLELPNCEICNSSFEAAALLAEFLRLLCSESEVSDDLNFLYIKDRANMVAKAVQYICNHYSEKITLEKLCSIAMMSQRLFTESFRAVTGQSSSKFILNYRISKATHQLSTTTKSISDIARDVGFVTSARLTHVLKEVKGLTPREYRKLTQEAGLRAHREWEERYRSITKNPSAK